MERRLQEKRVLLCITGGIAAYKAAELTSRLIKEGARVKVIMTRNAREFIQPLTLETLSGNPVYTESFQRTGAWEIDHISLAKWAELVLIAPATANIIGKLRMGIADDLLSTTLMAAHAPIMIAPAMNTRMYTNPAVQENIMVLRERGVRWIPPATGRLACGDLGEGKLADIEDILQAVRSFFQAGTPLSGVRALVTAGPTREAVDPVRFISNPSSGKMGYAIAAALRDMGARVELVSGPVHLRPPEGIRVYPVVSATEMYDQVMQLYPETQLVFMTAAVGDYRPAAVAANKIKKDHEVLTLELVKNPDILKEMGVRKDRQILVGFAAETENLQEYAARKMQEKNLDFILANDVTAAGAGFESDTNRGLLMVRGGEVISIPTLNKQEFAIRLIQEVLERTRIGTGM